MALQKVDNKIKKPKWIDNINWLAVRVVCIAALVISMISTGIYYGLERPDWPKYDQIEKVKVGMTQEELFSVLGDKGWNEYDEYGYEYKWRYKAPNGKRKIFLVTINNGVVTDIDSY